MDHVIDAPAVPVLNVEGGGTFPVRRVWCVGRNYAAHVREMGNDLKDPPFFFLKPSDALTQDAIVPYPPATKDLHHEVELLIAIGQSGRRISPDDAAAHIWGAGVAVDLTRRDLQAEAKNAGRPWSMAKGFDASAPVGPIVKLADPTLLSKGRIWLEVNDHTVQRADLSDMIWPVPEIIASLSRMVDLVAGDVILTGTPEGVGPLQQGDEVRCGIAGLPSHTFVMGPRL